MSDNRFTRSGDSVSLDDEAQVITVLRESVQGLWEVVNNLTRLRPTKKPEFRVTIFGSARIPSDPWVYAAVRDLAAELARMGCAIVTGGGPGLMQAANERAALGSPNARSIGIRVHLPYEQEVNEFVGEAYTHRTFFSRLHHFTLVSDAFVIVPGGIGTVLELTMIWQLLQVRKTESNSADSYRPHVVRLCRMGAPTSAEVRISACTPGRSSDSPLRGYGRPDNHADSRASSTVAPRVI